ncbi:MAG: sensor histidine kinase [Acidobacteria bacterium]|nr:sensor histidine kinase [Acidobacteriota bacterium]
MLLTLLLGWTFHRFRVKLMASRVAVLNERNRIAREIHDSLGQQLAGVVTHLEAAKHIIGGSPETARSYVDRACTLAREGIEEARRSIWALRPRTLEESDLPGALAVLAKRIAEGTNTRVQVCVTGAAVGLSEEIDISLLRAAQEAATNAMKHARATEIRIELAYAADRVVLSVCDDGRGFSDRDRFDSRGSGFGLKGMRERIEESSGRTSVSSCAGGGTEIAISVPIAPGTSRLRRLFSPRRSATRSIT